MNSITFDTLKHYAKLKEAGFTEEQAKVQTEAILDAVESSAKPLATKEDLHLLKFELLKWMIGLSFAQMALIIALVAFLK